MELLDGCGQRVVIAVALTLAEAKALPAEAWPLARACGASVLVGVGINF